MSFLPHRHEVENKNTEGWNYAKPLPPIDKEDSHFNGFIRHQNASIQSLLLWRTTPVNPYFGDPFLMSDEAHSSTKGLRPCPPMAACQLVWHAYPWHLWGSILWSSICPDSRRDHSWILHFHGGAQRTKAPPSKVAVHRMTSSFKLICFTSLLK